MVHVNAVLTQIIFDHSLKIRLATSTAASEKKDTAEEAPGSPSTSAPSETSKPPAKRDNGESRNVLGKINNLITVDVQNITDGRDFLDVCKSPPSLSS